MSFLDSSKRQVFLNKIALAIRFIIRNRTKEGKDVEGNPFKAYNLNYAKKRKRHGLPTSPPDLEFDEKSGMIHRIDHEVFNDNKSVEIFINSPQKEQLAIYHNIMGAGKSKVIREFWGLSKAENEKLFTLIDDTMGDLAIKMTEEEVVEILKDLEKQSTKTVFRDK